MHLVGRGESEEKEQSTGPIRSMIGPNCSSNQAQPSWNNRSTRWIRETEDGDPPEEAKE